MKKESQRSTDVDADSQKIAQLRRLVMQFSSLFANLAVGEIDGKIQWALGKMAECLDADRGSLWDLTSDGKKGRRTHKYLAPRVADFPVDADIDRTQIPWFLRKDMEGEPYCIPRISDLPKEASKDKAYLLSKGTKALINVPYRVAGRHIHELIFAYMRDEKRLPAVAEIVPLLKVAGEIISSALLRMRMEEENASCLMIMDGTPGAFPSEQGTVRRDPEQERAYVNIIGRSPAIRAVFSRMEQVAETDSLVLILGETGTGKGLIANAIHELSHRRNHQLVVVNCAAFPSTLIESELFGREKGAFTSSDSRQIGRFELADKNTLVLDEIGELSMEVQAKLLRAIQNGEIERLGSSKTIKTDVRIIAITSRDIKTEAMEGRFRKELFYRLNVFPITMPPLRERPDDIPLLVAHFVTIFSHKMGKEIATVPKHTMDAVCAYSWPGNVRELEHMIERAVILTKGRTLHPLEEIRDEMPRIDDEAQSTTKLAEVEKRHILKILEQTKWKIQGPGGAAFLLGLHPNTLRGRMRRLGVPFRRGLSSDP